MILISPVETCNGPRRLASDILKPDRVTVAARGPPTLKFPPHYNSIYMRVKAQSDAHYTTLIISL